MFVKNIASAALVSISLAPCMRSFMTQESGNQPKHMCRILHVPQAEQFIWNLSQVWKQEHSCYVFGYLLAVGAFQDFFVSDNATIFKSAKKTLQRLFDLPAVQNWLTSKSVKRRFKDAKSPWWGGFSSV